MVNTELCCMRVEDDRALMKVGLGLVLLGHVSFVLAALVHGAVLRNISLHQQARSMDYAVANVLALTAGLLAVLAGIQAIVLSRRKKTVCGVCCLLVLALLAALLATASAVDLMIAIVMAIGNSGRTLLTHCEFKPDTNIYSITDECPFDPTRIYATTLVLWVLLTLACVSELLFSARCCAASCCFLRDSHPPGRRRKKGDNRRVRVQRPGEMTEQQHELVPLSQQV